MGIEKTIELVIASVIALCGAVMAICKTVREVRNVLLSRRKGSKRRKGGSS